MHGPAYVEAKKWYNEYDIIENQKLLEIPQVRIIIGIDIDWNIIRIILLAQNVFFSKTSANTPLITDANIPQKQFIRAL